MENKIFIITHKDYSFPSSNLYCPLIVGANNNMKNLNNNYYKDNAGDNISDRNSSFCELTGLYWMNKNVKCDLIGLVHYRRYFFKNVCSNSFSNILDEDYIKRTLKTSDIIVPKRKYLIDGSVYNDYAVHHNEDDLKRCLDILLKKYPEYTAASNVIMNRNYLYSFNMFITKKEIMDDYCEWLFDILFELEKETDVSKYDLYNQRIYGFLSERLFNIWIFKKQYKIHEEYVFNIEESKITSIFINSVKRICLLPILNIITKRIMKIIRMKG